MGKTIGQLVASSPATALSSLDYIELEQSGNSAGGNVGQIFTYVSTQSLRGYIDGFICSNAADTANDITISPGMAQDSTNATSLVLSSAITKRIDAAWSVGTDAGGMDTGSVASSQTYYIWAIKKDADASIDALFSLSKTSPTMPSGYTYKRRIMSVMTSTVPSIINFVQEQDRVRLNSLIVNRAIAGIANTNRTLQTVAVPSNMLALLEISSYSLSTPIFYWIAETTITDFAPSSSNNAFTGNNAYQLDARLEIKTDSSSQIAYRGDSTNAVLGIKTLGWIDDRGKNQ
jgi:hypothetical protein